MFNKKPAPSGGAAKCGGRDVKSNGRDILPASYRRKAAHPRLSFKGGALQALDRAPASASAAFLRHTNQKSGKRESSAFPLFPESKILRMPLQALAYGNFLRHNYGSRTFEGGQRIGQPGITGTNREVEQNGASICKPLRKIFLLHRKQYIRFGADSARVSRRSP